MIDSPELQKFKCLEPLVINEPFYSHIDQVNHLQGARRLVDQTEEILVKVEYESDTEMKTEPPEEVNFDDIPVITQPEDDLLVDKPYFKSVKRYVAGKFLVLTVFYSI